MIQTEQLDTFTEELHEWSLDGKEPACASRDLRYLLDLQEKRLAREGIRREESYPHVQEEIRGCADRSGNGYTSRILYREATQQISYRQGDQTLKQIRRPVTLYAAVVDHEGHEDRTFRCPNCGHELTAQQARDGCPHCGTFFETDEVYPCVASYYTVPGIVERAGLMDRLKKEMRIAGGACGAVLAVISFLSWHDMDLVFRILGALLMGAFYGAVFAFIWYMLRSLLLAGRLFREAGRAMPMLKAVRSRKKMTTFMQPYDPDFSYEAFEGRVLSLLRSIALSDDRGTLSVWEGSRDLSAFDKVADMQYRGAVYIRRCERSGNTLRVEGTAFLTNTYLGGRVREKDETIRFILEKEASGPADPGFSIHRVSCPSCGGSFDATHRRDCPYCGAGYELRKKDWVVVDMRK